ncbi:MAG TPA: saccharopine dehydrogenase NADP-binding domain-containing protein [Candidatus Acidoferrales bacterium]|nr:saccharopine dehydrogenase NADP-binding domain-containing protein [Candidatus Acidoferrales bacterium]
MNVAVYGASGHTARFVIAELLRRGHTPIAIGRDRSKTAAALALQERRVELRTAGLDSPESLDLAFSGTEAVIHCAGPFLDTARPVIEAALRARIHYFDLTAEQGSALDTFAKFDERARERGVFVVPATGFYGGLADLMATRACDGWSAVDRIDVAVALDSWFPTRGTRRTGERNTTPRLALIEGTLQKMRPAGSSSWSFSEPFGTQDVVELPFTETILIPRHIRVRDVCNYLNQAPLRDLRNPETPEPVAADERGRSNQRFVVDAVARNGDARRRVTVAGRDIYAVTAPIVVEALDRACNGASGKGGAFGLGQLVDASDFLETLAHRGEIDAVTAT